MKNATMINLCLGCALKEQQEGKSIRYAGRTTRKGLCERCWDTKLVTAYHADEAVKPLQKEQTGGEKPLQRGRKPRPSRGKRTEATEKGKNAVTRRARHETSSAPAESLSSEKGEADTLRRRDEVTAVSFGGDSEKVSVKLDMSVRTLEILRDAANKWGISMGEAVGSALRFCMKGKKGK